MGCGWVGDDGGGAQGKPVSHIEPPCVGGEVLVGQLISQTWAFCKQSGSGA